MEWKSSVTPYFEGISMWLTTLKFKARINQGNENVDHRIRYNITGFVQTFPLHFEKLLNYSLSKDVG